MRTTLSPILIAALLEALLLPGPARAGCTVDAQPLAFGIVDVGDISYGRGTIIVECDVATDVAITLTGSFGGSRRAMVGPNGARLVYEIFKSLRTLEIWGDGNGHGQPMQLHIEPGERRSLTVFGVVPAQPGVPAGTYSDQLVVVLSF